MNSLLDLQIDLESGAATGDFHRLIAISVADTIARVALLDPFHHFRVEVRAQHGRVTALHPQSLRTPFDLCPSAGHRLEALVDQAVTADILQLLGATDPRNQCTHLFDLSAVAIATMAGGSVRTLYRLSVLSPLAQEQCARLERDGEILLQWQVHDMTIQSGAAAGTGLARGFTGWVARTLSGDAVLHALILRRAWFISQKLARARGAAQHAPSTGACWAQMPGRAETARRLHNLKRLTRRLRSMLPIIPGLPGRQAPRISACG